MPVSGDRALLISVTVGLLVICGVESVVELQTDNECPEPSNPGFIFPGVKWPFGTPDRGNVTLPRGLSLTPSPIPRAGLGIIANTFIPKYTWLGEYEGEFISVEGWNDRETDYAWSIYASTEDEGLDMDDVVLYVDGRDMEVSNWMRYINCARHSLEENVSSVQCHRRRYYLTIRDVAPGQELLVYYGRGYALRLGINDDEFYNKDYWRSGNRFSVMDEEGEYEEEEEEEEEEVEEVIVTRRPYLKQYLSRFKRMNSVG